jgi:hypothetical protein
LALKSDLTYSSSVADVIDLLIAVRVGLSPDHSPPA